jgi:hypothetical protein
MTRHQELEEQHGQRKAVVLRVGPGATNEGALEFRRGVRRCSGLYRCPRVGAERDRVIRLDQHAAVIQVADDTPGGVHRLHRFRQPPPHQEPVGAAGRRCVRPLRKQGAQGLGHARVADVRGLGRARTTGAIMSN